MGSRPLKVARTRGPDWGAMPADQLPRTSALDMQALASPTVQLPAGRTMLIAIATDQPSAALASATVVR